MIYNIVISFPHVAAFLNSLKQLKDINRFRDCKFHINICMIVLQLSVILNDLGVLEGQIPKFSWGIAPNPTGVTLTKLTGPQIPRPPAALSRLRRSTTPNFVGRLLATLVCLSSFFYFHYYAWFLAKK